jgi:FkbM family methyltransferase
MKWPSDTRESQKKHALKHVSSLDFAIDLCSRRRTAVQAGGNMGLWPMKMATVFERVLTFEPEPVSLRYMKANLILFDNVEVREEALGATNGYCSIERRSLGSHRVVEGNTTLRIPLDVLGLDDVDLLQLDTEGYELEALRGAVETIKRSHPIIQVELRGFTEAYGASDKMLIEFLASHSYKEVGQQPGNDFVFRYGG